MSILINRVYTKKGDRGTTRLAGGQERSKDDKRLEAFGTVDELNAVLGLVAEEIVRHPSDRVREMTALVRRVQNELFDVGGELATLPEDRHEKQAIVSGDDISRLEREMDVENEHLATLRSFVLPGGGMVSAFFHQARTVCRRAERRLVTLHGEDPQRPETIQYLNRLGDWLFVMGRGAAAREGKDEVLWRPGARD